MNSHEHVTQGAVHLNICYVSTGELEISVMLALGNLQTVQRLRSRNKQTEGLWLAMTEKHSCWICQEEMKAMTEKHSCWICREKMSSEALLLQHYENHMKYACEDGS